MSCPKPASSTGPGGGPAAVLLAICMTLSLSSCIIAEGHRDAETLPIRITGAESASCQLYYETYLTPEEKTPIEERDGVHYLELEPTMFGGLFILILQVGDGHPEWRERVLVEQNYVLIRKITVKKLRKLPRDDEGVYLLPLTKDQ